MTHEDQRKYLIGRLLKEQRRFAEVEVPNSEQKQKQLLRALFNVRLPERIDNTFLEIQNDYLQTAIQQKGITDFSDLTPMQEGIYLWRGDITTLRCDAIVNAANSGMCGCFIPNHACIDNAIHTYAGVQLRLACAEIMKAQGHEEETGTAKITSAYNLPCKFILHTVGPIIKNDVSKADSRLLAKCYRSCLELADENGVKSIAFCCISTGVFHFPNEEAAQIAINAVKEYRHKTGSKIEVIFNVFKELDEQIYRRLLATI